MHLVNIILASSCLLFINACTSNDFKYSETDIKSNEKEIGILGHTFLKVTETDSGKFIIIPCDAFVESYRIDSRFVVHNWGQEKDFITINSLTEESKAYHLKGFNENSGEENSVEFEKLSGSKSYLRINGTLFIDNLSSIIKTSQFDQFLLFRI